MAPIDHEPTTREVIGNAPRRQSIATRLALIVSALGLSWYAMQACHELGHVLGAVLTGGTVERVVIHPATISRTDIGANPNPLVVVWAGPLVGVTLPFALWLIFRTIGRGLAYLWRFLLGFCLVANGAYIGIGPWFAVGDTADMVRLGVPTWPMIGFGGVCVPLGLIAWNGLGPRFGLGMGRSVNLRHAIICAILFTCTTVGLMLMPQ